VEKQQNRNRKSLKNIAEKREYAGISAEEVEGWKTAGDIEK